MWQCFGSRRAGGVASEQSPAGVPAAPKGKCLCQSVAMSNSDYVLGEQILERGKYYTIAAGSEE